MLFTKENLVGTDYDWINIGRAGSEKDANPTRNRFDRFNGFCMLRMINFFNRLISELSVEEGRKIELLISNELPLVLNSEVSVFNWLKGRFLNQPVANTNNLV